MNLRKLLFAGLLALLTGGAFADGAPLFRALPVDREVATFTPTERKRISNERESPGTRRATVVSIDRNALFGTVLNVTAPDGTIVTFIRERSNTTEETLWSDASNSKKEQVFSWFGRSPMGGEAHISVGAEAIVGQITFPARKGTVFIRPINGSYQLLAEDDPTKRSRHGSDDVGVRK
jgi:hypothetical protein